jgi:hypothetical protein
MLLAHDAAPAALGSTSLPESSDLRDYELDCP